LLDIACAFLNTLSLIIFVRLVAVLADAVEKVGGVSGSGSGLSDRTICRLHRLDIVAIDAYASV
jgi:hypothetical protein